MPGHVEAIPVPAEVAIGAAHKILDMGNCQVQFGGTFVAEVQLEGTINGDDWFTVGTPRTAPGLLSIDRRLQKIRANVTDYTSGTPTVHVIGDLD